MPKLICIMGPTASGKSQLAIKLAEQLHAEIISVDSALVYRTMDIGTAKPSVAEQQAIPHHLINIREPWETYSAQDFCNDAELTIKKIKNKNIILTGGTFLYFKALQFGLAPLPKADQSVRKKIVDLANEKSWQHCHDILKKIDPVSAKKIHPNDPQRIQRALEVYEITGKAISELYLNQKNNLNHNFINIAIAPHDRKILHNRIQKRFEKMIANGFLEEVQNLYKNNNIHKNLPAMRSVGYRQLWNVCEGNWELDFAIEKAITATRQYAKRQLTWLRGLDDLTWFDSEDPQLSHKVLDFLKKLLG